MTNLSLKNEPIFDINEISGCALLALIERIGYPNIVAYGNNERLLREFETDQIIEYIINDNDRDIEHIITVLFNSLVELNSLNSVSLNNELESLMKEIAPQ